MADCNGGDGFFSSFQDHEVPPSIQTLSRLFSVLGKKIFFSSICF